MLHKVHIKYNLYNTIAEHSVLGDVILFGDVLEIEYVGGVKISTKVRDIIFLKIDDKTLDRPFPQNVEALIDSCAYPSFVSKGKNKVLHSCTIRFFRSCQECCQAFSSVMFTANEENLTIRDYKLVSNSFRYEEILEMSIDGQIVDCEGEYTYEKLQSVLNNLR